MMNVKEINKTDLRITKTIGKLRQAFSSMMADMPFDQITVFDLCEKAGIRRATFYKHFKDKYDFLSFIVSLIQEDIVKKIESLDNINTPLDFYTRYITEILNYLNGISEIVSNILNSPLFPEMLNIIIYRTFRSLCNDLYDDESRGLKLPAELGVTAGFINGGISHIIVNFLRYKNTTEAELISDIRAILGKILN